jgi:hypothetical protein
MVGNIYANYKDDADTALENRPMPYQKIQPEWLKASGGLRSGDIIPVFRTILEENVLKNEEDEWYVVDPNKEEDLEKLRNCRILKQFEEYKEQAFKPKGKIKESRVEALRAGFKQSSIRTKILKPLFGWGIIFLTTYIWKTRCCFSFMI